MRGPTVVGVVSRGATAAGLEYSSSRVSKEYSPSLWKLKPVNAMLLTVLREHWRPSYSTRSRGSSPQTCGTRLADFETKFVTENLAPRSDRNEVNLKKNRELFPKTGTQKLKVDSRVQSPAEAWESGGAWRFEPDRLEVRSGRRHTG